MRKALRVIKNICKAILCLLYTAVFVLCCYSWPASSGDTPPVSAPLRGTPSIAFASGSFPADTEELTVVLQPGEVSLLDGFTALKSLDVSGSTCYDEFIPWIEAHPDLSARYTVDMPSGVSVAGDAEELDLSGMDSASVAEAAELLPYLPKLKAIHLGSGEAGGTLTGADIVLLRQAAPEATINYSFSLAGQSVNLADESLSLSGLSHEEVAGAAELLSCMQNLTYADLGSQGANSLTWEDIGILQAAKLEADFAYSFTLYGKNLSTVDEMLDFNHINMTDRGEAVRAILPYMQNCRYLDMDFCGVSDADMASIRDDFPDIKVVWRIWFGTNYSVRTDVEKILASKPSKGGVVNDEQAAVLRYCTDLKYLDLGHNMAITDLSFVYSMPNLEVLVIAMNPLTDLTPLASCPHLEYLELNSTEISDLSPLSGLTELRHLNIANCKGVSDISPLYGLTELERLWIGSLDPVPADQVAQMQALAPDCEINTDVSDDPTGGRWRIIGLTDRAKAIWNEVQWIEWEPHPRYALLREQFGYEEEAYSFYWLDPLYDPHD